MAETLATEKNEIYKKLPGIEVPVGDALVSLSEMWTLLRPRMLFGLLRSFEHLG